MLNLRIAIEVAIHNVAHQPALTEILNLASSLPQPVSPTIELGVPGGKPDTPNRDTILKIDDYVFIKQGFQFVKISLADILVLESEDNYTYFVCNDDQAVYSASVAVGGSRPAQPPPNGAGASVVCRKCPARRYLR